jgi:hypothetical protein
MTVASSQPEYLLAVFEAGQQRGPDGTPRALQREHAISNSGLVDLVFLVITSPVTDDEKPV